MKMNKGTLMDMPVAEKVVFFDDQIVKGSSSVEIRDEIRRLNSIGILYGEIWLDQEKKVMEINPLPYLADLELTGRISHLIGNRILKHSQLYQYTSET